MKNLSLEKKQLLLYQQITSDKPAKEISDVLYQLCGNPVMVMDYTHRIYAHAPDTPVDNDVWSESIRLGQLSEQRMDGHFHTVMKELLQSKKIIYDRIDAHDMVLAPVITAGTYMGVIIMLAYHGPICEQCMALLKIAVDVLAARSDKRAADIIDEEYSHGRIIRQLLDGTIADEPGLLLRMKSRNWQPSRWYRVVLVDFVGQSASYKTYIREQFDKHENIKVVITNDALLLLEQSMEKPANTPDPYLLAQLKRYRMRAGMSNPFDTLLNLPLYHNQAQKALAWESAQNGHCLTSYNNCMFDDFLANCKESMDYRRFLHPGLSLLQEYDAKHDTNLLHTLHVYLDCGKSVQQTALRLHLHRNTVNYRMQTIRELLPGILEQYRELLHLQLSYLLHQA